LRFAVTFEDLTHIDRSYFGQRSISVASLKTKISVLALLRVIERFKRRRSRTQHDHGLRSQRSHDRSIATMITRGFFLFVRTIVLFVDNHQSDVIERREHRRASADHNSRFAFSDAAPFVCSLAL